MYAKTINNAIPKEINPARVLSAPIVGPTLVCSLITQGAGSAPPFNKPAKSFASSIVKLPEICVLPPVIGLITRGALYTTLSIVIATIRFTLSEVICPHLSEPSSVMDKSTVIFPDWLS